MKVEHVGIYARDGEALAAWYCDVLDLAVVRKLEKPGRPPIYFLRGEGGVTIEILPTGERGPDRGLQGSGLSHIGIAVDDVEQTASRLAAKGVAVHDVHRTTQGWVIGYFEDPEGNALEIVQR